MEDHYQEQARILKTLSEPSRLKIVDMLSCGEKCACELLDSFNFTQPTLSHHMKILMESGLVQCRKEGLWSYYSLDAGNCRALLEALSSLMHFTEDCICHSATPLNSCKDTSVKRRPL